MGLGHRRVLLVRRCQDRRQDRRQDSPGCRGRADAAQHIQQADQRRADAGHLPFRRQAVHQRNLPEDRHHQRRLRKKLVESRERDAHDQLHESEQHRRERNVRMRHVIEPAAAHQRRDSRHRKRCTDRRCRFFGAYEKRQYRAAYDRVAAYRQQPHTHHHAAYLRCGFEQRINDNDACGDKKLHPALHKQDRP